MKPPLPFRSDPFLFSILSVIISLAPVFGSEDGGAPTTPAVPAPPVDPSAIVSAPIPNDGQPRRYSLADYLALVMARNPGVLSAELDSQSIDYARRAAQAAYFPKLEANGFTGYEKGQTISPFLNVGANNNQRKVDGLFDVGGGTLTIPIFTEGTFLGINTPPRKAIAIAQKAAADASVTLAKDEIRFRATVVYLQAIAASKQADILQPKLQAIQSEVQILTIKARHHLVSEMEIKSSQAQLAQAKALAQQAQWFTASALIQVTQLLGLDDPSQVQIEANYPQLCAIPGYQTILTSTLLNHPALATQQSAIDEARAQHALDQSAFLPTVTSRNSYEWGDNYNPPGTDRWLAALDINVPLFDGGENYYKVRASEKKLESEKEQLYQTKLDIENDLQAAYTALENSNAAYATSLVALNQKYLTYRRNQMMSGLGALAVSDYLNSQIAYSDAAYQAEADHFQLLLAYAGLEKVTSGAWSWPLITENSP